MASYIYICIILIFLLKTPILSLLILVASVNIHLFISMNLFFNDPVLHLLPSKPNSRLTPARLRLRVGH